MTQRIELPQLQQIVSRQLRLWESEKARLKAQKDPISVRPGPWITVSREPGAGGRAIAGKVAARLGFDLLDRSLLERMAEGGTRRAEDYERLEHGFHGATHEAILLSLDRTWPGHHDYVKRLAAVAGELAARGRVVFLGRGIHFLLPPEDGVRVRIVAPRASRCQRLAREQGIDRAEADRRITEQTRRQDELVERTLHRSLTDVLGYDLVFNTDGIGPDACVDLIVSSLERKVPHRGPASARDSRA